jgi:uncharacterized protein involved in response to NO
MVGWADIRREPFRLLFPLGVAFGCLGVGHWLGYAMGWSQSYSGFYHASLQVGSYMSCFIVGFLLTALPRFSSTAPASSVELGIALGLLVAHTVGLWLMQWILAEASLCGLLLLVAVFAGRRFAKKRSAVGPPTEFVWVPIALALGFLGTATLALGQRGLVPTWLLSVARPMAQQGFPLGIVLGVGGFMAPRLMGREALLVSPTGVSAKRAQRIRLRRVMLHGMAGMLLACSFWMEGTGSIGAAYLLRALVVSAELAWTTQLHRPPAVPDRYVKLVWLALWMVVLGLWGAGLIPRYRVAMLHLVFLGGLSLMTFAVGTMVVLSHAGQARQLRQPLWIFSVVGLGLAGALIARFIAEWQTGSFFLWLGVASACWLIAGVSWLGFVWPRVTQPLSPGAFEQVHRNFASRNFSSSY